MSIMLAFTVAGYNLDRIAALEFTLTLLTLTG
jgi:hypothetical protein